MKFFSIALVLLSIFIMSCSEPSAPVSTAESTAVSEPAAIPTDVKKIVIQGNPITFQDRMLYLIISLNLYRAHVGKYPSTQNNLDALISPPQILEGTGQWIGPYADSSDLFLDPWGRKVTYAVSDGVMDLRSLGADGMESKDDLIAKEMFPDVFKEMEKLDKEGPIPIPLPTQGQ